MNNTRPDSKIHFLLFKIIKELLFQKIFLNRYNPYQKYITLSERAQKEIFPPHTIFQLSQNEANVG